MLLLSFLSKFILAPNPLLHFDTFIVSEYTYYAEVTLNKYWALKFISISYIQPSIYFYIKFIKLDNTRKKKEKQKNCFTVDYKGRKRSSGHEIAISRAFVELFKMEIYIYFNSRRRTSLLFFFSIGEILALHANVLRLRSLDLVDFMVSFFFIPNSYKLFNLVYRRLQIYILFFIFILINSKKKHTHTIKLNSC